MDGVIPPFLKSEEGFSIFVEELERVMNDRFGGGDSEIRATDELKSFIKHANGVEDLDFCFSGMCAWELLVAHEDVDIEMFRVGVRSSLARVAVDLNDLPESVTCELEVKGGFHTGQGIREGNWTWYSYYLYCRKLDDDRKRTVTRRTAAGVGRLCFTLIR